MDILVIIFGIASIWMIAAIGKTELERKNNLKDLEVRFLVASAHFQQYRYQMLKILEIVYDKASEADEQFKKDYEKIVETIDKKFEEFGDEWIKNMNSSLGYETEYKNWQEATKYIESVMKKIKYDKFRERN